MILILAISSLLLSPVQTFLANYLAEKINAQYHVNLKLDKVKITPYGKLDLKGVLIGDHRKDTLAYVKTLTSSIFNIKDAIQGNLDLGDTQFESPIILLNTSQSDKVNNWEQFLSAFATDSKPSGSFSVSNIRVENGTLIVKDENKKKDRELLFDNINMNLEDLIIHDTLSSVSLDNLSFQSPYGTVKKFKGTINKDPKKVQFLDFLVATDSSLIQGDITSDVAFNKDTNFSIDIKKSKLNPKDLNPFVNITLPDKILYFDMFCSGNLKDVKLNKLSIETEHSFIEAEAKMENILSKDEVFIKSKTTRSSIDVSEINEVLQIFGRKPVPSFFGLKSIGMQGEFDMNKSDISADINLVSSIMNLYLKGDFHNIYDGKDFSYKGLLSLFNIRWDRLPKDFDGKSTRIEIQTQIKGFTKEHLSANFSGTLKNMKYWNHTYEDVPIVGSISKGRLQANMDSKDRVLDMNATILYDLFKELKAMDVKVKLNKLSLDKIFEVFKKPSSMSTDLSATFNVVSSDKFWGEVNLRKIAYKARDSIFKFKDLNIITDVQEQQKFLEVNSEDIISARIQGNIKNDEIVPVVKNAISKMYKTQDFIEVSPNQNIDFDVAFHSPFFKAVMPQIKVSEDTVIEGNIMSENYIFYLNFDSPQVQIFDNKINNIKVKVDNATNNSLSAYIQDVENKTYKISDFRTFNFFKADTIFFKTTFKGPEKRKDYFDLNYYFTLNDRKNYVIGMKPSTITFNKNDWKINKRNNWKNKLEITQNLDSLIFKDLMIEYRYEKINIDGYFSKNRSNAKLKVRNVNLIDILSDDISFRTNGLLSADFHLNKNFGFNKTSFQMSIEDFEINKYNLGSITLEADALRENDYVIKSFLQKQSKNILDISGVASYRNYGFDIDLDTKLEDFDVKFIDIPDIEVSEFQGLLSGNINLRGDLIKPKLNGYVNINKGSITIPYTKVRYLVQDGTRVNIDSKRFKFKDISLTDDTFASPTIFNGYIEHRNFRNWFYNLHLDSQQQTALLLNTEDQDNEYFYGKCFAKGDATLYGYHENLKLNINIDLDNGTYINIPMKTSSAKADNSFIKVKQKNSKENKSAILNKLSNFDVKIDMDINPKASVRVFTNDIYNLNIFSRGSGKLIVNTNLYGDLTIWGSYIISEGSYELDYLGLISKKFELQPSGTITWEGDPFEGYMRNVRGLISINANPDILTGDYKFNREIRTDVTMVLNGSLSQPKTNFNIDFPNTASYLRADIESYLRDEQQLQTQALSLITGGVFLSSSPKAEDLGKSNIDEGTSKLISSILKDSNSKIDVGVSYESATSNSSLYPANSIYSQNRLGFDISSNISDRVRFNGRIGVPTGGIQTNTIAGEGELQILLNKEKSLSAVIFNRRSNFQDFLNQQQGYSRGVGISYNVDFSNFRELWTKVTGAKREQEAKKNKDKDI